MSVLKFDMFCQVFHEGQVRKYTGNPYIEHPHNVRMILRSFGYADLIHACMALGHDLLEDTEVSDNFLFNYLNKLFLPKTAQKIYTGISLLTNRFTKENYPDFNRTERAKLYNEWFDAQLKLQPFDLATIICNVKCADIIDNAESIVEHDPKFAQIWLPERLSTLDILGKYAEKFIFEQTLDLVTKEISHARTN